MNCLSKYEYFDDLTSLFNNDFCSFFDFVDRNYNEEENMYIKKAYEIANFKHGKQKRKSGEEYIIHPLKVACLLAIYGFDYETVCGALLHDTVEDTDYTLDDVKKDFNTNIAILVDGVTKMKGTKFLTKEQSREKTHEKIMNSITKDARIIAIKLADRLHNMYTLEYLPKEKQISIANETKDFYINLSRILGIYQVKEQLQDLCLFYLDKNSFLKYYELRNSVRENYFNDYRDISRTVRKSLSDDGIYMDYIYKVKNIGGIYEKETNGYKLQDIDDLVGIKMMVNNKADCYDTLQTIKDKYNIIPGSIYDIINKPKYNGYSTLNVKIDIEKIYNMLIKIRTFDMKKQNELGMVSNWNLEKQAILNKKCSDMIRENELNKRIYRKVR